MGNSCCFRSPKSIVAGQVILRELKSHGEIQFYVVIETVQARGTTLRSSELYHPQERPRINRLWKRLQKLPLVVVGRQEALNYVECILFNQNPVLCR